MSDMFRYVSLGDSTAVGVGADAGGGYPERVWQRIRDAGIHAGLLNQGQSGAVAADVLSEQLRRNIRAADLVTLGVGSNDLWRLTPVERYRETLGKIADKVAATGAHVVVCNLIDLSHTPVARWALPNLGLSPALLSARVRQFNAVIQELSARPRFTVADLHTLGEGELGHNPDYFSADGFHPSSRGYARWADYLWPEVERVVSEWALTRTAAASG